MIHGIQNDKVNSLQIALAEEELSVLKNYLKQSFSNLDGKSSDENVKLKAENTGTANKNLISFYNNDSFNQFLKCKILFLNSTRLVRGVLSLKMH